MINKTKTKILTLSVASIVGLAAITVLASNANNALDFQGEVKQNAHLELNELKLIENPTKPGVTSQTDVTWKMDDNELVATKEVKGTTNTVKGEWTLSIWGQSNSITESESFILWGTKNALNAKTSIIGASNRVKITEWEGNVVLSSSNWTVKGTGNIILSSNPYSLNRVNGSWNIALSVEWSRIKSNGSMAIGKNIQIENEWTFVFNAKEASAPFKSKNDYTTLIFANNGMIINTNKRNTQNVGVTVNWGIKVGHRKDLDQQWSLITQDNCLQLKSTEKGAISLKCRGVETDRDQILQTPKCWRNAANYHYTDSRWKGAENSDFCAQGTFEGDKSFRSEEQRKTPTGIWSYADRGFTYDFTICFRDKDPLCAPKNLSKTWRCKTDQGNAVVCEANLQIKKMECAANQHLEDEGQTNGTTPQGRKCLPNQKTVSCDDKGINKANGSFTNEKVSVTRDANGTYTTPSKCTLKCNEGFKLNEAKTACMSSTKQVSCDKTWTLPSNATWKDATVTATRNSQKNSWDTPKCDFECKGWYKKSGKSCVAAETPRCITPTTWNVNGIELIPGTDSGLTEVMTWVIVEHEISWKKCQYRCKKGYYFDQYDGGCLKSHFSCTDGDDVTNATLVWSGNNGLVGVDNQTKILIWTWENPTKTCQYKCKTGYERKKYSNAQRYYCAKTCPSWKHLYENNCVSDTQSKSCVRIWTLPSNATWKGATVTATRNSQKNSWDIPKCDFKCNRWYNKSSDGKSCVVAETPRCTGTIPNATLGSGQDLWLTGTQQITLVKTIDPNKKCQAVCNSEFELKDDWHNRYCAKSNSDNKCKNYEYYNPTTKKCESRCIGTYEVEDLHADCSYKSNVWKCRRFWHAAIWIGGDDMWAAHGKRGPWQENVTEEFCETSYGPFDVKISYEFQSYGGRQCNESKCKQWSSLCEWESRSYNKKCSDSFNESDPRYFAGTCERIDPSCSWKSD